MRRNRIQYQVFTQAPPGFSDGIANLESAWHQPWSEPVRTRFIRAALMAPALFFVQAIFDENITLDKWYAPFSDPVRIKPDLGAARQQAYFAEPFGQLFPEENQESKWHQPWSEPSVKSKIGLSAALQQTLAWGSIDPFFPEAVQESKWHQPWSEPSVKAKIGLGAWLQRDFAIDTIFSPASANFLQGYNWWSEPVRELIGLKANLQQTLAYHPRILPTPNVTVTLDALETGQDTALIGINVTDSTSVASAGEGARVSLREAAPDGDDAAVSGRET